MTGDDVNVYKRWKIGNIGYIVGRQGLKWQQIGNTIGNNRQHCQAVDGLMGALQVEYGLL